MNLAFINAVPGVVFVVLGGAALVFVALTIWWAYDERSARGVQRRASDGGKTAAAGVGLGLASVVGTLAGFGSGITSSIGALGGELSSHAGFIVDLGLAGLGASVVSGAWNPSSMYAFLAVCGLIVVVGVMWRGS